MYPPKISEILTRPRTVETAGRDAEGSEVNFSCGSFVRFYLQIDRSRMVVTDASFASNGCGFMLAAAQVLCESVSGRKLSELRGLDGSELTESTFGEIVPDRSECVSASIQAFRRAFVDLRSRQIEEFRGEISLICTCFGVTEDDIEAAIKDSHIASVDDVSAATNAGSGCGSCRMIIQEILDGRA